MANKEKEKGENPLKSGAFPPPPATTAYIAPASTDVPQPGEMVPPVEQTSISGTEEKLEKITIVLNEDQREKIIALKVEYQRAYKAWISDTEFMRRLIESATLQSILTPSSQAREKQRGKREKSI
jgi:hypothetical protein